MTDPIIDPEIRRVFSSLSVDDIKRLEKNALNLDRNEATYCICQDLFGMNNLTKWQRIFLLNKAYSAQVIIARLKGKGIREGSRSSNPTRDKIMQDFGVGAHFVNHSVSAMKGLEMMNDMEPGIKESVLTGALPIPDTNVGRFRQIPEEQRNELVKNARRGDVAPLLAKMREVERSKHSKRKVQPVTENTGIREEEPFNANDLGALLIQANSQLDKAYKREMITDHPYLLNEPDGRNAAYEALNRAEEIIMKYRGILETYF